MSVQPSTLQITPHVMSGSAGILQPSLRLPNAGSDSKENYTVNSEASWPSSVGSIPSLLPQTSLTGAQAILDSFDVPAQASESRSEKNLHQNMDGQLSLDENKEIKFHGKSSGYYYIRHSGLHRDHFWSFPKPGIAARTQADPRGKLVEAIYAETKAYDHIPPTDIVEDLMGHYWSYVHPLLPLLHRGVFQQEYRSLLRSRTSGQDAVLSANPNGESSNMTHPAVKPCALALFFAILAVSSRYCTNGTVPRHEWEYWPAGDQYAKLANEILRSDHPTCRLSSIQANILLAYREIGCGLMAAGWHRVGSAVRMAQDMGLFKEVERWNLPVPHIFDWETKQTRWASFDMGALSFFTDFPDVTQETNMVVLDQYGPLRRHVSRSPVSCARA